MSVLRLVTVAGDPEREPRVAAGLADDEDVELVMRCVDRVELLAALKGGLLDAAVLVGAAPWIDEQVVAEAAAENVRLVAVVSDHLEADALRALGIDPLEGEVSVHDLVVRCATQVVAAPPPPPPPPPGAGPCTVIGLWGPKGAPGVTRLAIEVAGLLAAAEPATVLVDADPCGGDLLQALAVAEELPSLIWAARAAGKDGLGAARLTLELRRGWAGGPLIVPGLPRPGAWRDVPAFGFERLLDTLAAANRYVVLDTGHALERPDPLGGGDERDRLTLMALGRADIVVAVCRADPIGAKNFIWGFDQLRGLVAPEGVRVVANRVRGSDDAALAELLVRHVGKRPVAYLPDDRALVDRALAAGGPVCAQAPGSAFAHGVRALVMSFGGALRGRGFLSRLAGRAAL